MNETFYSDTKISILAKSPSIKLLRPWWTFYKHCLGFLLLIRKSSFSIYLFVKSQLKRAHSDEENCGVIVVAHGAATASSMVEYTNLLFSTTVMRAVDMPINQSVEETLEKVRTIVKQNQYKKLF